MFRLPVSLLGILCLASCAGAPHGTANRAESPLRDRRGTPVVIRIPRVAKGGQPQPVQVMSIDAKLFAGSSPDEILNRCMDCGTEGAKARPRAKAKVDGLTGEVKTHRGETFHAYFPIVKVSGSQSQEQLQAASRRMAAELYTRAKRECQVYPMDSLALRN